MNDKQYENLCALFKGGHCPICDDEYVDLGMSRKEAKKINDMCCKNSYHPTDEDLVEMGYGTEKDG